MGSSDLVRLQTLKDDLILIQKNYLRLEAFADALLQISFNGQDVCGGDIQEIAVNLEIIEEYGVTGSCGESCSCAESGEFPANCLRKTYKPEQDA